MRKEQYILFAHIFQYPRQDYHECVIQCMNVLCERYPDAANVFRRFADFVKFKKIHEIEEIFNITFHIQAICYLDVGYVLFGEDYRRGEFLVNMKREHAKINHNCGEELADNLPHVLYLLALSEDEEFVKELAVKIVRTALIKMLEEFKTARMELRAEIIKKKQSTIIMEQYKTENIKEGNVFQNALQALLMVLDADFTDEKNPDMRFEPLLGSFLHNCTNCHT